MNTSSIIFIIVAIIALAAVSGLVWYIYMKARYRTVPSNEALIVTGPNLGDHKQETNIYQDDEGRYMKVVRGGGHRLKMFQTGTRVSLKSFQLHIRTPKVYTQQGVGIYGEAVATVKVSDSLQGIVKYAEQFLGKDQEEIETEIAEVLNANLRAILSKMTVAQINGDRETFNEQVREVAQEQLDRMGFHITSLGLSDLRDDENYLENLGRPQVARVKQEAEIAESEANRETQIKQAKDGEDISNEENERQTSISNSRREREVVEARNLAVTNQERENAEAAGAQRREENRLKIEEERIRVEEQEKTAELRLAKLARENEVQLQKQQTDADAYQERIEAETQAEALKRAGEAEADNIRVKGLAEVEAIEKRAEAMRENGQMLLLEKLIDILPEYAKAVSDPMSNVESIRIMDGGDGNGMSTFTKNATKNMANIEEGISQMTGFDMTKMLGGLSAVFGDETDKDQAPNVTDTIKDFNEAMKDETDESGTDTN